MSTIRILANTAGLGLLLWACPGVMAEHPLAPLSMETLACASLPTSLTFATHEISTEAIRFSLGGMAPILPTPRPTPAPEPEKRTNWGATVVQSGRFLFLQHAFRLATQQKTRRELRGPFFQDYIHSVQGLSGWDDGDPFLTNYVGHPMQGAIGGYFQVHNNPKERLEEFSAKSSYWKSRFKAMAYTAAYSTHYELSPIGEAGIGNVGLRPGTKGAVDLVITPTLGFAWMVGEDAMDAKVIARLEEHIGHRGMRRILRTALNPCRTVANVLRGVSPWYRDTRGGVH